MGVELRARVGRRALSRPLLAGMIAVAIALAATPFDALFGPAAGTFFAGLTYAWIGALVVALIARGILRGALPDANQPANATMSVDGLSLVVAKDEASGATRRRAVDRFRGGVVVPDARGRGAFVVLRGDLGIDLEAWTPDVEGARQLLDEMRLSAAHRPHTFAFFFGLRITVGLDGVVVAWPLLRRRRFVPYARIADVRSTASRVVFELTDGKRYEVETIAQKDGGTNDEHRALLERIADARAAYARSERAEPMAMLARAGRATSAWVKDLRALTRAGGGQYRSAALPPDALVRIASDPAEPEEMRVGAAIALGTALEGDARARLRVAAEASASPRVRVALAAAAEGLDDDALASSMESGQVPRPASARRAPR